MRVLITGAASGIGLGAARELLEQGHTVLAHARSQARLSDSGLLDLPGVSPVVADLADLEQTRAVAGQVAAHGGVDAIIHNAGVLEGPTLLPVNVVAPYLLTAMVPASRLVFISSSLHHGGRAQVNGLDWSGRRATATYSDSKLLVTTLAAAVGRLRPTVASHAVDPGWVPTKMGGANAPDDLVEGHRTQAWLVQPEAPSGSGYWHHHRQQRPHASVVDVTFQTELLDALSRHTALDLL